MAVFKLAFISKLLLIIINVGNIQHCSSYCPQKCDCSTSVELHCVNSNLRSIPESDNPILDNITVLNMSFNQVDSLQEEIFSKRQFLMLEVIDLSNNEMSTIHKNTFKGLENVRILWLVKNKLNSLPENVFEPLKNLKELYLQDNQLETIERTTFRHLNSLTILDLRNNNINSIQDDSFFYLQSLQKLLLARNVIKKFESKMFNPLKNLCYLDVQFVIQSSGYDCKRLGGLHCNIKKKDHYSECEVSCDSDSCEKKRKVEDNTQDLLKFVNSRKKESEESNDLVWAVIITVGVLLMLVITLTMLIVVVRQSRDQIEDDESELNDFEPFHGHVKPLSEDNLNLFAKSQGKKMCV